MSRKGLRDFNVLSCALSIMILVLMGSGCATTRGVLDVQVDVPEDTGTGTAVTIARVTDNRVFQEAPDTPDVPSLKGAEINDPAITSRAVARKRNTYGKAMGDILLPEGRSVADLVRDALVRAFRESGYQVTGDPAQAPGNAVPVEADIQQFWAWFSPGFWSVGLQFEAIVKITGEVGPFADTQTVRGHVELRSQAAGTKAWMNTINKGIEAFIEEVKTKLAE